ncbi:hypothetical protein K9U39_00455 [Rhodoblastus acidophilus]|uniref:Uncharacterized protein n=1 Tax=Candidatus Rhodoblastus alkanivorans TaxID=2954117 RepID=A0ABS9Z441_9HYPH|nr:hypothetical protein [Candidatus Rhodoblastus alkanivorans]MCI4677395.1 hypothetical protein [Candidatus Rhodoblastus alkanivorans]MCI4682130.1 hypothetical protein [Candidatus Rhodoblastus alkanivorans]MDI4639432.1 hypothetical protein [Rhodoblastus acidophilus]
MVQKPKHFGRRNLPQRIEPPPVVTHAPEGLEGATPPDGRRLRSIAVALGACGVATIGGLALLQALRNDCRNRDPNDPNAPACHSSGGSHGGTGYWRRSSNSGWHGVSFGGFGAIGESGAHGGSFGGFHGWGG